MDEVKATFVRPVNIKEIESLKQALLRAPIGILLPKYIIPHFSGGIRHLKKRIYFQPLVSR